jgi:DNA polymerase-1
MAASPLDGVELRLIETIDDAMDLKRWLGERREGILCIDTESGGLSPWRHRLRTVQFGDMRKGWTVPWERWGGVALEILRTFQGEWGAHHGVHDWKFLSVAAGHQLAWETGHDTLTQARIDDPTRPNGLKPLGARLIDPRAASSQKQLDEGMAANRWTWDTVPIDFGPYWAYAALDPVLTAHLDHQIRPRVMATAPKAYDLERAANRICTAMMMHGLLVDVPYAEKAIAEYGDVSQRIRGWLAEAHQITSPSSGGQLRRAFERMGQEIVFWTDRGAPQFTKETLTYYHKSGVSPRVQQLAQYLLAVRRADKMPRDYLQKFLDLRDSNDILRMSINVMGAVTSRMSVSEPPLQQLSRDELAVRGAFIPHPGYVYISCDLDQVEMRTIADVSGDQGLVDAFYASDHGGVDFFTVIASELFQEKMTKQDPRRQLTKNFCYARGYGAGADKLAATAHVSVEAVKRIEHLFDERFPGMKQLMERLEREAVAMRRAGERPGVRLPSGRFVPCEPGAEYRTLNYRIQGWAAEYMKRCLVNLESAGLSDYMVLPIHDEVLLEVPEGQAEDILHVVEECMSDRESYRVPLTAGGKILPERWAKAS